MDLAALRQGLRATDTVTVHGVVESVTGLSLRFRSPRARVGDAVWVHRAGTPLLCEVVGFDGDLSIAMPVGDLTGVGPKDRVISTGAPLTVVAGSSLLGRVVDGLGQPIDGGPPLEGGARISVMGTPPSPLQRRAIDTPLPTGVRVIDALLTLGDGQRIGLFAGSGVGKSTLLASLAKGAQADVVVVALIGERGREVGEFVEHALSPEARARSVVVVATSDAPALLRLRAAHVATAYAEYFRDQDQRVLLLVDSITRFARAQRDVGLAAGEPPTRRGFTPSVFAELPKLLERAGKATKGSMTAIYTVLVEGGDLEEPIADEVRGIVDGHIVLDRTLAAMGRYPAVQVLPSLSRVMPHVVSPSHAQAASRVRSLLAAYEEKRDLIELGAYVSGSDARVDEAMKKRDAIETFLRQGGEPTPFEETLASLSRLAEPVR